jgi:uncharacterized protein (DUF2384 family)
VGGGDGLPLLRGVTAQTLAGVAGEEQLIVFGERVWCLRQLARTLRERHGIEAHVADGGIIAAHEFEVLKRRFTAGEFPVLCPSRVGHEGVRQLTHPRPVRLETHFRPVFRSLSSTLQRMSLAYADEAIHLREVAALSDRDIARATGSGVSTVSAWLRRERAPRGRRAERLVELSAIADRLAAVLGAERVPVWLNKPIPALEHRKPLDVIAAGGYEQVSRVVAELESPTFG